MIHVYNTILYIFNTILLIFGTIILTYSLDNLTNVVLNCESIYLLSITIIINSIICLASIKDLKLLGLITTIILFSYNNVETIDCDIDNYIYIINLLSIINNRNNYIYIMYYSLYLLKQKMVKKF